MMGDFGAKALGIFLVVLVEIVAGFGGDREASRDGETDASHLGEACAFAAEEIFHFAVAFGPAVAEVIDVFQTAPPN